MKRILMIMFFLMIGLTAISQVDNKKMVFEDSSKRDLQLLKSIVKVKPEQEHALLDFFYKKYKQYVVYNLSEEMRNKVLADFEKELMTLIDSKEALKLEKNKKIVQELMSDR